MLTFFFFFLFLSHNHLIHLPLLMQDISERLTEKKTADETVSAKKKRFLMKISKRDRGWENSHATAIVSGWGRDAFRQEGCKLMAVHHAHR